MEILIGLLLPPLIEVVNKDVKNDIERYIVAIAICLLAATAINWQAVEEARLTDLLKTFAIISTEAQTVFNLYWRNSFLRDKLQAKLGVASQ